MSEEYEKYTTEELVVIIDHSTTTIIEGLLVWMDMSEALVEQSSHADDCDGDCSGEQPEVEALFKVNKDHLDRVVESFRTSLKEISDIKDKLTSDASEVDSD